MSLALDGLGWAALALTLMPTAMVALNLLRFRKLPLAPVDAASRDRSDAPPQLSVLIPARDEAGSIQACLDHVRAAGEGVGYEVVVLNDHSTDETEAIVLAAAENDPRIRLVQGDPLPGGYNGKQHACWQLAQHARADVLTWIDADVRLQPGALGRLLAEAERNPAQLLSGFPRQRTGGLLEKLVIPQIHAVLLGYLPMGRMRKSASPGYGAGCGQWFAAKREAYFAVGGHGAIVRHIHDGIALPRLFRRAGHGTDIFDASDTASCRMYTRGADVWSGFTKNATAGMASPVAIMPWTLLLLGGWVLPWVTLALWLSSAWTPAWSALAWTPAVLATAVSIALGARFRQGVVATLLRPVGIATLLLIQWDALRRKLIGQPAEWRGRQYVPT